MAKTCIRTKLHIRRCFRLIPPHVEMRPQVRRPNASTLAHRARADFVLMESQAVSSPAKAAIQYPPGDASEYWILSFRGNDTAEFGERSRRVGKVACRS